ncbi:MAG: FAD-binding oxidoreductase [Gammaproteobacteria bacterium]
MDHSIIISSLSKILGNKNIIVDETVRLDYGKDLTQKYIPNPIAIIFPENTQQIVDVVKLANSIPFALVPSGGRTGYSGGAVAISREVVVSFEKMNRIIDFNIRDRIVTCEAGITTRSIQNFAKINNLCYPIDFAAVDNCQIGGNVATNAGGIRVIYYGMTRNWVCGLKVVTGQAEVLEFNHGLTKNATGYDFKNLFVGSEGTLGFITEISLKLTTQPNNVKVLLFSLNDISCFNEVLESFNTNMDVHAFEFFSELALHYVISESKMRYPFRHPAPYYGLIEYESTSENEEAVNKIISNLLRAKSLKEILRSHNINETNEFWKYRKNISLSLRKFYPYKYDIAVLPSKMICLINELTDLFNVLIPNLKIVWFGHIGDGNIHLNILKPDQEDKLKFFTLCDKISDSVYVIVQKYQGTISAEHGIGLLKKPFLKYSRTPIEIKYMKNIKKLFDPNNIMNPGKLF